MSNYCHETVIYLLVGYGGFLKLSGGVIPNAASIAYRMEARSTDQEMPQLAPISGQYCAYGGITMGNDRRLKENS